jgi:hypothetical protein
MYNIENTRTPFNKVRIKQLKTGISLFSLNMPIPIYPAAAHKSIFNKEFIPKPLKKYKSCRKPDKTPSQSPSQLPLFIE